MNNHQLCVEEILTTVYDWIYDTDCGIASIRWINFEHTHKKTESIVLKEMVKSVYTHDRSV